MGSTVQNARPLHEIMEMVASMIHLQVSGVDVAIPMIAGAPGGGKTESLKGLTTTYDGWGLLSTHFAEKPLEEFGGIPDFVEIDSEEHGIEKGTIWSLPDIIKVLRDVGKQYQVVVWLLDDIHLCSPVHYGLLFELLTERKLRDYKLPSNVAIVMAGNHKSTKAGAKPINSAIVNRSSIFPVYTDLPHWVEKFAIPHGIHPAVLSFLQNKQNTQFFHEDEQVDDPWGSPRTWTKLSNVIVNMENWKNKTLSPIDIKTLSLGHVSKDASSQFSQYYSIFSKFDIPKILNEAMDIKTYKLPEDTVDRYALAFAVLSYYSSKDIKRSERKTVNIAFAHIVYKYMTEYKEIGLMLCHEMLRLKKILKFDIYLVIGDIMNQIEPGCTSRFIEEVTML